MHFLLRSLRRRLLLVAAPLALVGALYAAPAASATGVSIYTPPGPSLDCVGASTSGGADSSPDLTADVAIGYADLDSTQTYNVICTLPTP